MAIIEVQGKIIGLPWLLMSINDPDSAFHSYRLGLRHDDHPCRHEGGAPQHAGGRHHRQAARGEVDHVRADVLRHKAHQGQIR